MASKEPVRVLVTQAADFAGQIEPADLIARAYMATHRPGPVILHLHLRSMESADEALNGARNKFGFLFQDVVTTTDVVEACTGVNLAVVHVGFSTKKGTEAKDFLPIFKSLVLALRKHAAADCKVLAVGDPANTSELFSESSIPAENITCLARLDHYLAYSQRFLASRVENAIICGNRPSTLYLDTSFATVKTPYWEKSGHELVADDAWMDEEFIIKAKCSSATSAASSACDQIPDWVIGTPEETLVSMGEDFGGSHSVQAGRNGTRSIVEDLGASTPAIFQSENEGNIRQMKEQIEMIFNQLKEMENRAGTELHYYSSRIDEFERHADRAFENVCNKIEFLEREIANLQSKLANAQVYLHGAFQEVAKWRQLYWNLRSRVFPSRVSIPVPHAA